jgi:hypothetical protein
MPLFRCFSELTFDRLFIRVGVASLRSTDLEIL